MAGASRYWNRNSQKHIEAKGHGPAYQRDGGRVLKDTETQPPYNANIGPDGPDLNVVGFPTVKVATKARYMDMGGGGTPFLDMGNNLDIGSGVATSGGDNNELIGKIGGALGQGMQAFGKESADKEKAPPSAQSLEPGRTSGGGDVRVAVSEHVRRRGER